MFYHRGYHITHIHDWDSSGSSLNPPPSKSHVRDKTIDDIIYSDVIVFLMEPFKFFNPNSRAIMKHRCAYLNLLSGNELLLIIPTQPPI